MEPNASQPDPARVGPTGIYLPEHPEVEMVRFKVNRVCEEQDCGAGHKAGIQLDVFDPRSIVAKDNKVSNAD